MADGKKKSSGMLWLGLGAVALLVGVGAAVALSSSSAGPPAAPPPDPNAAPPPQPQQAPPPQQQAAPAPSAGSGGGLGSILSEVGPLLQGLGQGQGGGQQTGPVIPANPLGTSAPRNADGSIALPSQQGIGHFNR